MKRHLVQLHRILGLFLALHFFVIALTGSLLVWKDELEGRGAAGNSQVAAPPFAKAEAWLKSQHPQLKILALFKDDDGFIQSRLTESHLQKFRGSKRTTFDSEGIPIEHRASPSWIQFILKLHRELLLGSNGKYLVGLCGLFFIFIFISGLFIAPLFHKKQNVSHLRQKLGRFHKAIGLNTFAWLLLVSVTGIVLTLNSLLISTSIKKDLDGRPADPPLELADLAPLDRVLETLRRELPDEEVDFISYPNNEFSRPQQFVVLLETARTKKMAFIDGKTAELIEVKGLSPLLQLLVWSEPLHFGNYGGFFLKLAWSFLGLLVGALPLSGLIVVWLRKRASTKQLQPMDLRLPELGFRGATESLLVPTAFILSIYFWHHPLAQALSIVYLGYILFSLKGARYGSS